MNKSPAPANNPATVKKGGIPTEYIEQQSLDGVPLDFSFKEIKDLSGIRQYILFQSLKSI